MKGGVKSPKQRYCDDFCAGMAANTPADGDVQRG